MKYFVLVYDGAADTPNPALNGKTPYEAAHKPTLDRIAKTSFVGTVSNVPAGMVPESDTANLAILSYDPKVYSRGRSPLEAVSMGLAMDDDHIAFRCNVVTLSEEDDLPYEERTILDHSADEITTAEATELIGAIDAAMGNDRRRFFPGVSYRHCLLWHSPDGWNREFTRPHDILGQQIGQYLPPEPYLSLFRDSYEILENHPVNAARRSRGLRPANSIWLWSPGAKPSLPSFSEKWGLRAAVISAVDLIKGIGLCAGMTSIDVEGATGNIHTNFKGKGMAAIDAFREGYDLVYVHVEAPDECGHRAEIENKVLSVEKIDTDILTPVLSYLEQCGEPFRVMTLPDHPTPLAKRTHTIDPVPFQIYDPAHPTDGVDSFTEATAAAKNHYLPHGYELMNMLINGASL